MPTYKAPLRDIQFVINEVLDTEALYQSLPGLRRGHAGPDARDHRRGREVRRERALAAEPERRRGGLPVE
jgi:hypothetical protein